MVKLSENLFIIIDGSSYLYRSYYALLSLKNSLGKSIGAIYGVFNMIKCLLIKYKPNYVVIVFDDKGKTFRNELFKDYKSNRSSMPHDLKIQIEPIYEMIRAMGLPLLIESGVEADDVIGTLSKNATKEGYQVLISTNDKDMAQLVSSDINLITTSYNICGPKEVKLKFGVSPNLIIDYIALTGDKSDNIPGVFGIGKKTAKILLLKLGELKILYKNLEKIKNLNFRGSKMVAIKLELNRDIAFLSYKLASIKTDVPLKYPFYSLRITSPDIKKLMLMFQYFEFKFKISKQNIEILLTNLDNQTISPSYSLYSFFSSISSIN